MIDDTLRCIRESMMTLLDEKEYSAIQMKEIAQRANIGRRTLYRYFENKDQILKYIAESLINRFTEEIERQEKLTLQSVTYAFYVFIEKNRSEFILFLLHIQNIFLVLHLQSSYLRILLLLLPCLIDLYNSHLFVHFHLLYHYFLLL